MSRLQRVHASREPSTQEAPPQSLFLVSNHPVGANGTPAAIVEPPSSPSQAVNSPVDARSLPRAPVDPPRVSPVQVETVTSSQSASLAAAVVPSISDDAFSLEDLQRRLASLSVSNADSSHLQANSPGFRPTAGSFVGPPSILTAHRRLRAQTLRRSPSPSDWSGIPPSIVQQAGHLNELSGISLAQPVPRRRLC